MKLVRITFGAGGIAVRELVKELLEADEAASDYESVSILAEVGEPRGDNEGRQENATLLDVETIDGDDNVVRRKGVVFAAVDEEGE